MKSLPSPFFSSRLIARVLLLGLCAGVLPATGFAAEKDATLQIQMRIPPSWDPFLEDDVKDAFLSQVRDVFRREGYTGTIKEVDRFEEPSAGCCLVTINLLDWRLNHTGNVDCTFTASLQTDERTRNFGIFSGMALRWMNSRGRFGLANSFEDAAEDALERLYADLAETELVPGLRPA